MEVPALQLLDKQLQEKVDQILNGFVIGPDRAQRLKDVFVEELIKGMKNGLENSSLQMENTYVPQLANGTEEGSFLALDLGGTNFRVILIQMQNGEIIEEQIKYYHVEEQTRLGPGRELFEFLASCVMDFVGLHQIEVNKDGFIPLGFTFSFPMIQTALDKGILVSWTKSFNCPGVVGEDAARMLSEALDKAAKGANRVKVVAILNDTTGTLVKGSFDDHETCIGVILGTGCNGAYFEKAEHVSRWQGDHYESDHVIIDAEFGAFGDNGCIDFLKTDFDREIDRVSLLPGSFTYEKYFAGKYMGDLVRLVLLELHSKGLLLQGHEAGQLAQSGVLKTMDVSHMMEDVLTDEEVKTREVLSRITTISTATASADDVNITKYVCRLVSERCALMVAVPLAVFLERMERGPDETSAIAVTGSLFQYHPTIRTSLEKYMRKWTTNKSKVYTFYSDDGSGLGAGLVAAIASRL